MKRKYKARSLQAKLLYRFLFILIALLVTLGFYQHKNMKNYLYQSRIELLDSRFKNIDKDVILKTTNEEALNKNIKQILNEISTEEVCVAIINQEGNIIASKNKYTGIITNISKEPRSSIETPIFTQEKYLDIINKKGMSKEYSTIKDNDGRSQIVIWREIGDIQKPIGLVQISTYIDTANLILKEQARMYIISAIVVSIIGMALGIAVLKHTLKPLKQMTNKLDEIDTSQLNTRLNETTGQIEIDKLSNKFNNMFDRLEKSFIKEKQTNEKMKNFILDASHELRTPLTSIQGFIEVLQMGAAKDKNHLDLALRSILMESQRLNKLVNNLLALTKLEQNDYVETKKENIKSIIMEVSPQLEVLMQNRKLKIDLEDKIYCDVNRDQIKQVIYNLVQNAINYTNEESGKIKISTRKVTKNNLRYIEISVSDNGEGMSEENINLIFDRFYRCDKHRSRKKGGYGLGLSIVKQIVDNHNGSIEVSSVVGEGSTFTIYLKESK